MIIVVCGGRGYRNRKELCQSLTELNTKRGPIKLVIHGACKTGADQFADEWAVRMGIERRPVAADWETLRYAAGPIRNEKMAEMKPDAVVAFSGGRGTLNMIRCARARGIEVIDLRSACPLTNKLRYADRDAAKRQLEYNRQQYEAGVQRRRENGAYECAFCGGWHLSSHYRHENTAGVDMRVRQG